MSYKLIPDAKSINLRTDDLSQLSEVERSIALEQARIQLEQRSQGGMNVYLVSLELIDDDPQQIQESLVELGSLVRSLGDEPAGVTVQKRSRIVPATLIGTGKAEELRAAAKELKIDYVVFDQELSPSQVRNLEQIIERPILDRAGVILQIFRKNAKTREAKTQVEIAHLEYLAPRISNSWIAFERQRGGGSGGTRVKGAGETQLELDKRRIREKIASLRKDLERIQTERSTQRKLRAEEFTVVLVGYTNAGKTTLMNALTDSHLSAKDALFETLDSAVRTLKGSHNPRVLVTDTVGFIRNIPHGLVASFRSTLQEAARADLLIHVVDVSHPRYKDHIRVTDEVLKEVGASDVERMYVFNKTDALKGEPRLAKILARAYKNAVCVSAQQPDDIRKVRDALVEHFSRNMLEISLQVAYDDSALMGSIYAHARVLSTEWTDEVARFRIRVSRANALRFFTQYMSQDDLNRYGLAPENDDSSHGSTSENTKP
ncbi:MAG: GTPase HflX [Proteobacteria bacterium]|nr:GTPase HflX [Pseudomonadota bacterium]